LATKIRFKAVQRRPETLITQGFWPFLLFKCVQWGPLKSR